MQIDATSVTLQWQRRLYDTRGSVHPNARAALNVRHKQRLDTQRHCCTVDVADWGWLLHHIEYRQSDHLCSSVIEIAAKARLSQLDRREHLEVRLGICCVENYCVPPCNVYNSMSKCLSIAKTSMSYIKSRSATRIAQFLKNSVSVHAQ